MSERSRRASPWMILLIGGLAAFVLLIDQVTKALVIAGLVEGKTVEVIPGVFELVFVRNSGAAFSIAGGMTWIFSILATAVVVTIFILARRIHSVRWAVMLGLLLGGTLGNLTDRVFREPGLGNGHVIDFISTPWMMPAIYNVADMCIVAAMILFAWFSLLGLKLDGTRESSSRKSVESA